MGTDGWLNQYKQSNYQDSALWYWLLTVCIIDVAVPHTEVIQNGKA
jgi:hypothetical protein